MVQGSSLWYSKHEAVRGRCENIPWGQSGHSSAVDSHTTPRQTVIFPPALLHFRSLPFPVARSLHSPLLVACLGRPVWNICMQNSASSVCLSTYLRSFHDRYIFGRGEQLYFYSLVLRQKTEIRSLALFLWEGEELCCPRPPVPGSCVLCPREEESGRKFS